MVEWFQTNYSELLTTIFDYIPKLGLAAIVLFFFWWLSGRAKNFIVKVGELRDISPALLNFVGKFSGLVVFVIGIIITLSVLGIDVTTLTASLGLTGFALGFALKDTISNLIAGIMVIFYKTFRKGDYISVAGVEGNVEEVNLRYTVLNMMDGKTAYIPNSTMFTRHIIVTKELSMLCDDDDGYII